MEQRGYLARSYATTSEVPSRVRRWAAGNRYSAGWERVKVGWDDHMEGQSTNPSSQHSHLYVAGTSATTTAPPAVPLCPCFLEALEGGGLHLLGHKKCSRVWPGRLGCPPPQISCTCSHSQPATRLQPRSSPPCVPQVTVSVLQRWQFGHTYLRRIRRAGGFPLGKVPFSSLDLALPSSACACCYAVASCLPPQKKQGGMAQPQSQLR